MKRARDIECAFALFFVFAQSAGACVQTFPEWNRGSNFTVTVAMNGKPMPRMRVLLTPEDERKKSVETTSDDTGIARFSDVKPGRYFVEAVRLGVEVGPGTVTVSSQGGSDAIAVEWPLRPAFTVASVAGRFERHFYRATDVRYVPPQLGPIAGAKLTLSRVDSEKAVGTVTTDSNGNFDFRSVEPGSYLLHIEEKASPELWQPINDYLQVNVDPSSARGDLRLQVDWTSCGIVTREIR